MVEFPSTANKVRKLNKSIEIVGGCYTIQAEVAECNLEAAASSALNSTAVRFQGKDSIGVEYDKESNTAHVKVEIIKNYNDHLGEYPTDTVFMEEPYAEYFLSGGEYDEYIIFTTKFVNDDGIYPLQIAIGIDGEDIS